MNLIPQINGELIISSSSKLNLENLNIKDPFHLLDKDTLDLINCKFPGINKTDALILPTKKNLYQIKIINGNIIIETNKDMVYNALITLFKTKYELYSNMSLTDYPKYQHREFSIDIARHYFSVKEIKKLIDEAANLKLNKIHLHLTDNQGWRIEIKKYPLLHNIGGKDGYYTQSELKDIINYARARQIDIIPEIDIPGHVGALLSSYPQFSCNENTIGLDVGFKKNDKTLCFGNHETINFIKEILNEIIDVFPSKYIHIGCDEIDLTHNKNCSKCKAHMKENNLHNFNQVITKFINEIANYLYANKKDVIVWNDATRYGQLDERIIVQNWFDYPFNRSNLKEFNRNRNFIFGSTFHTYFDYPASLVTLENAYDFSPKIKSKELNGNNILGISSHIWTEVINNPTKLEEMIFPRLIAFSENAWTINKDYNDFNRRLKLYLKELDEKDINYKDAFNYNKDAQLSEIISHFNTFLDSNNIPFSPYQSLIGIKLVLNLLKESNHMKDIPELVLKLIKKEP